MPTASRLCPTCGVDKIKDMGWEKQDEHVCKSAQPPITKEKVENDE